VGAFLAAVRQVAHRFPTRWWAVAAAAAVLLSGCTGQDKRLQQHREKLESLGATTAAVCDAWLAGRVSGTYTQTALDQTYLLVEQERTALASSPQALLDPRGAALSQSAERLSRLLAAVMHDVRAADGASVRRRLAEIPIAPAETP
jgi:hypothetical protein